MIRLAAADMDGTFLRTDKSVTDRTRKALLAAGESGIIMAAATGRSEKSLRHAIDAIEGFHYAICSNGASVIRLSDGRVLRRLTIPEESSRELIRIVEDTGAIAEAFIDGQSYTRQDYWEDPMSFGAGPVAAAYVHATRKPIPDMISFLKEHAGDMEAMDFVVHDPDRKEKVLPLIKEVKGIYVTSSHPSLIEIGHRNSGKGGALAWLADYLGIAPEEVIAFGNEENDREMLLFAGVGVAVENSTDALKAAADRITLDNDHDGVAVVLEEYLQQVQKRKDM